MMSTKKRGVEDVPLAFGPESFKLVNGSLSDLCSLQNENLFPPERVIFSNHQSVYAQIMPSLLLASRIILDEPQSFNVFIARGAHQGTVEEEDVIPLGPDELISIIRSHIPDLDFDPDMAQRGDEYGMTYLRPNEPRDLMTIDYDLIKSVIDKETGAKRTTAALAYIAILLCHELAHVLEFRSIRNAQLCDDGEAFETPPGITGTEAGTSWETRVFGGSISPVSIGCDLAYITGLSIQSFRWRYLHMAMDFEWISRLFDENFWTERVSLRLFVPYNSELALTSSFLFDEDQEKSPEPRTPSKRRRGRDVRVELRRSPNKSAKISNKVKVGQIFRRTCGGKRLLLPPSWPLKDTSGTGAADLSNALSARTTPGSSTTASGSLLPPSAHAQLILEAKDQPVPTINSSPKISSSKIASTVVLAKMNEPQETQPQQSAENGTVACESGLLSACTEKG